MTDIDKQIEQARQRLKDLQAKAQKQKRKDETRRNIIYGAALRVHLRQLEPSKRAATLAWLQKRITRASDRAFMGLDSKPQA